MAWDRCNQDSVWREIEVSTANSQENGNLRMITERRAGVLSGMHFLRRSSRSLWWRGYEGIYGKFLLVRIHKDINGEECVVATYRG